MVARLLTHNPRRSVQSEYQFLRIFVPASFEPSTGSDELLELQITISRENSFIMSFLFSFLSVFTSRVPESKASRQNYDSTETKERKPQTPNKN